MSENDTKIRTYEIFGLHEDQVETLAQQFGDAVHEKTEDSVTLDLHAGHADNLAKEGFFMRAKTYKPQ